MNFILGKNGDHMQSSLGSRSIVVVRHAMRLGDKIVAVYEIFKIQQLQFYEIFKIQQLQFYEIFKIQQLQF